MIRLDKFLSEMGVGTRQEVKKLVRSGAVLVDGEIAKKPELKIDENNQVITVYGKEIAYAKYEYYMLNKPQGVVSATEDSLNQTVVSLIKDAKRKDLFPVGRLDKDTEGLLLITNDGQLAHRLLAPGKHVDKCYFAKIDGIVNTDDIEAFKEGINIGSKEEPEWTKPADLTILKSDEISEIRLVIQEGKYHQVKRMFHTRGKEVVYLKRESMGILKLDEKLALGEYRPLTDEEIRSL